MTEATAKAPKTRNYTETLFLPVTDFPMKAGLPEREPELLKRWEAIDLYGKLREAAKGRARFILHDGPPYANSHIHVGTALNKILKDMVVRSHQMLGHDANYVPGFDCHGLPIEWQIEQDYRAKGKSKDEVPVVEFLRECRAFAEKWIDVQREEFKRLGVVGDWRHPYTTMAFPAEAQIARELMKFAANGLIYRGSKPVMWSVVERTALAEAEVEYLERVSPTVFVKFPIARTTDPTLKSASVVIWTTTPWTLPANRAIAYSNAIAYGLYEVTAAPADNWAKVGDRYLLADKLAEGALKAARVDQYRRLGDVAPDALAGIQCRHPLSGKGYDFSVPLIATDYVTDEAGTGFVHTAPGHGADDYLTFVKHRDKFAAAGTPEVPNTVGPDGAYYSSVPLFAGARVIDDEGKEGDADDKVVRALIEAGELLARGKLRHQYPHSWRSKKPVIFRNTPQWFVAMDKDIGKPGDTLRARALAAIKATRWVPPQGENRITGMIESKPDWVLSRQRTWGVPLPFFVREAPDGSLEMLKDEAVDRRIVETFEREGASAWYAEGAAARFLGEDHDPAQWTKIDDICDVWFDSGCSHAFTLEVREDLKTKRRPYGAPLAPKKAFDRVMYLEGSDQHRGWFQSSLLESCATRGHAPFDLVLTHGFILDEKGIDKMSKSKGNVISPQEVAEKSGADILRLWTGASDYADDVRFGPEVLKTFADTYRKLRNTLRWMLGTLHHFDGHDLIPVEKMPELEQVMLNRLVELDAQMREAYAAFDYKRVVATLSAFMAGELSAFYVDVRRDALYCDPASSVKRRSALTVIDQTFRCLVIWLAPILAFTAEEAWLTRFPSDQGSVHLEQFPIVPATWENKKLVDKWALVRKVRRVVTGALEIERAQKRVGSSLEAAPIVYIDDPALLAALKGVDFAEVCITSAIAIEPGPGPAGAFRLDDVKNVAVVPALAVGKKCARSWKISPEVGADAEFPDLTPRDGQAMREWQARRKAP